MEDKTREIYARALKLLGGKNYFATELEFKLGNIYPGEDFVPVIERLNADRYLDDERTFCGYVRWKTESGYGPYYIREKLYQRGVERSIQEIVDAAREEELDIDAVIASVIQKYRRTKKNLAVGEFKRSCLNYLSRRGFELSDSLRILKKEVVDNESDFFEGC